MPTIKLSSPEYEQIKVDIEQAVEELTELSKEVDWFTTEMPERLAVVLEMLTPEAS